MSHPIVHWEIGGPAAAALEEFYSKAFGWGMSEAGPDYTLVESGDGGLGGAIRETPPGMPPYVTVYVRVDDLKAKLSEIEHLGGTVTQPPTAISDTMSFALFTDPGGAVVGLLQG